MFLIFMSVIKNNGCACSFCNSDSGDGGGSSKEAERGIEVQNIVQSTRKTFGVPSQGVLIESSDKIVRLSEARYACETRLWELEQQFEVKAAKVREEYLAAVLEIHASEANGNQHAHHS
jgi:hypothetical protein